MESLARHDLHPTFFNCFRQYEMCVGGELDEQGRQRYNTPDLKDILPNQKVLTVFVRFVKNRNIFHITSNIERSDIGIIVCAR